MFTKLIATASLIEAILSSKDYSDCTWFGNRTNAPKYPTGVCTAHSHESELDGLDLYSTKMECNDFGELTQFEWDNTECDGPSYNTKVYRKGICSSSMSMAL